MTTITKIKIGVIIFGIFLLFPGFTFFASLISGTSDVGVGFGFAGLAAMLWFVGWMIHMGIDIIEQHIHKEKTDAPN